MFVSFRSQVNRRRRSDGGTRIDGIGAASYPLRNIRKEGHGTV